MSSLQHGGVLLSIVSIVISVLAFVVSGTTLWRTQLAPFKLITTAGPMHLRRHAMTSDDDSWFIPHVATTLSFTNAGAKPGKILDIRAVVRYPSLPIDGAFEIFSCDGEFDAKQYALSAHQRFVMLNEAQLNDLTPFVVLPKSTITKFLVLSTRWDRPVRQRDITIDVEIKTDKSGEWSCVHTWKYSHMDAWSWAEIEHGSSFVARRSEKELLESKMYPEDLHKYTLDSDLDPSAEQIAGATREISPASLRDRRGHLKTDTLAESQSMEEDGDEIVHDRT